MQSNLGGSSSGLEFKRPDLDLLFRLAPSFLSKRMDESKETAFPGHESRQESELNSPPPLAFDLIVAPCKIVYAGTTMREPIPTILDEFSEDDEGTDKHVKTFALFDFARFV